MELAAEHGGSDRRTGCVHHGGCADIGRGASRRRAQPEGCRGDRLCCAERHQFLHTCRLPPNHLLVTARVSLPSLEKGVPSWQLAVSAREAMAPPSAVHNGVPASRAAEPTAKLAKATPAVADGPGWAKNMIGEAELVTPRPAWWWTAAVPQDTSGYHEERQHLTALPLTVRAVRSM